MHKATEDTQAMARKELDGLDRKIEQLVERLVASESNSVIEVLEREIDKLERRKLVLADKAAMTQPPRKAPAECIEPALGFLSSPWNIWDNGNLAERRTVLRLVFAEPLECVRKEGIEKQKPPFLSRC